MEALRWWRWGVPPEGKSLFQTELDVCGAFDDYCEVMGIDNGLDTAKATRDMRGPTERRVSRSIPRPVPPPEPAPILKKVVLKKAKKKKSKKFKLKKAG